ncbi:nucleotide pyrophosphohydrolase [Geomonas sp. RF6]|uniref:nucleotide pyrophosphohydrolase n=1 Tax=Geomonas sp. RF6 TaxID=2897342 RepID=UPI001E44E244|nr:nucleotide pyrophosphohydrolase [Geomonas sp. RF6]UFS69482.1 nucleotide pyrophosphohydrolase [Geomonas sp. RF6]
MTSQQDLLENLRRFVADRNWTQFHDPKNLSMLLASEVGELLAELRWVSNAEADSVLKQGEKRQRIEYELGDVYIALLLLAERVGIDLVSAAERKLAVNLANYPVETFYGVADRK